MLTVRELKELTRKLDAAELEQQLGAFVLVQRPVHAPAKRSAAAATVRLADHLKAAPLKGVFDFEDLWVATLPPLSSSDSFVIGRAPDCDVIIDADSVSKRHAQIAWYGGKATIEDLTSANGVFVNSVRLRAPMDLNDNDLLALGEVHMFFMHVATLRRRMGIRTDER